MRKSILLLFATMVFLGGCASPARMDMMIAQDQGLVGYLDRETPLRKNISVDSVFGGEKTNPLWTSEIGNEQFREALVLSLRNAGLLKRDGEAEYELSATLLEVEQPLFGISLTVTTRIKYLLVAREGRKLLFEEEIVAPYTATFQDSALAIERLKLANEGSARSNIEVLIRKLYQLNVGKEAIDVSIW